MTETDRNDRAAAKPPLITASDVGIALGLLPLTLAAWVLPRRHWPRLARAAAPLVAKLQSPGPEAVGACVTRYAGARLPGDAGGRTVLELAEAELLRNLRVVSAATPFAGSTPVTLNGREHIDAALAQGNGVILWDGYFAHAGLLTKVAVDGAGLALVYSVENPGFLRGQASWPSGALGDCRAPQAVAGAGIGISLARLRRFWAVAARRNSSRAP